MTRKNQRWAKLLTLEVWVYLAEHPFVFTKRDLPAELFSKIERLRGHCPLCEIFDSDGNNGPCPRCPLDKAGELCRLPYSAFASWASANTEQGKHLSAEKIVAIVKAWTPYGMKPGEGNETRYKESLKEADDGK